MAGFAYEYGLVGQRCGIVRYRELHPRQAIEEIPQFVRGIPFAFRRLRSYDDRELRRPTSPGYDQFAGGMEIEAKATTEKREAELASKRLHVSILRKASI